MELPVPRALVFNLTITDFGVPVVIGGNYSVLATEIYQQVIGMQRFDLGATISVILLIPSVGAFLLNYYLTKKSYALISGQAQTLSATLPSLQKMGLHHLLLDPLCLYPDRLRFRLRGFFCEDLAL